LSCTYLAHHELESVLIIIIIIIIIIVVVVIIIIIIIIVVVVIIIIIIIVIWLNSLACNMKDRKELHDDYRTDDFA